MNIVKLSKRSAAKKQLGQGMTEYIIIVALVAIGAIGVYSAFGRTVQGQMAQVTNGLAGNTAGVNSNKAVATAGATSATSDAAKKVGLDTYGQNVVDQ